MSELISIPFSIETTIGTYTDCLFVSSDLTEEEIASLKQSRADVWVEMVTIASSTDPEEVQILSMQSVPTGCGCDTCKAMRANS